MKTYITVLFVCTLFAVSAKAEEPITLMPEKLAVTNQGGHITGTASLDSSGITGDFTITVLARQYKKNKDGLVDRSKLVAEAPPFTETGTNSGCFFDFDASVFEVSSNKSSDVEISATAQKNGTQFAHSFANPAIRIVGYKVQLKKLKAKINKSDIFLPPNFRGEPVDLTYSGTTKPDTGSVILMLTPKMADAFIQPRETPALAVVNGKFNQDKLLIGYIVGPFDVDPIKGKGIIGQAIYTAPDGIQATDMAETVLK